MKEKLDPKNSKVDGHVFLGLSLTRNSPEGHPDSLTHQTNFDLNEVQDREYKFLDSSNDDGWLAGGGEPGTPTSYKLAAKDSSHVEIMSIGTYRPEWGGVSQQDIIDAMESGKILIPHIEVVPTACIANPDTPPEVELRFDMDPAVPDLEDPSSPLPVNWAIRFMHNQLFKHFEFPSRFCPGPFHSTIVRKAEFRSPESKKAYFKKCDNAVKKWRAIGPKPLNNGGWDVNGEPLEDPNEDGYNSGLYLFTDRDTITHFFKPNFLPPYDTIKKRAIINSVLEEEWDTSTLTWKTVKGNNARTLDKIYAMVQRTYVIVIITVIVLVVLQWLNLVQD